MKTKLIPRKKNGKVDWKLFIIGKDWKTFFFWILIMFLAWSYFNDTQSCREMIENIDDVCMEWNSQRQFNYLDDNYIGDGGNINGSTWKNNQSGISYNLSTDS